MDQVAVPSTVRLENWLKARPPGTLKWFVFVGVFAFVWGMDTHANFAGSGDVPHYEMIAESLILDADLDLANDYGDPARLVGAGSLAPEAHAVPGRGGILRPVHDIGLPVVFAPYFAVAYAIAEHSSSWMPSRLMTRARLNPPLILRHLVSLGVVAIAGVMAVMFFSICRAICGSVGGALAGTFVWMLSPPLVSHAFLFFTEIPAALIVLFCYREMTAPTTDRPGRDWLLGLAVGFLVVLHIRNIGLVAAMVAAYLWRLRRRDVTVRQAVGFFAPIGAFVALRTGINFVFWGSLVTGPHASAAAAAPVGETVIEMLTRILGLLIDQEHGLLPYAPIYLLALPGLLLLARTDRRRFGVIALLGGAYIVPVLLPMLNRHGWGGGWSPAARFLVPIAPLLAVAGCRYLASCRRLPRTIVVIGVIQIALDLLYWTRPKLLWNDGMSASRLAQYLSTGWFDLAAALPSWHRPSVHGVLLSVLVIAVWVTVSMRAAASRAESTRSD